MPRWTKISDNVWKKGNTLVGIKAWGSRKNKTLYQPRIAKLKANGRTQSERAIKRGGFTRREALMIAKKYRLNR